MITVEEYLRGRLAFLAKARDASRRVQGYFWLQQSLQMLCSWVIVPYVLSAEQQFQYLVNQRLRVGTQDLKIAATALANKLVLVTRNQRDFAQIPGLVIEDWSV
jgi:tRNA(fMet)-specific endonuclease VapC